MPQATTAATPSATPTPAPLPAFAGDSAAFYLVDAEHPIVLDLGAKPIAWTPRPDVVVPGGQSAVRFGLMPVRCPGEEPEAGFSSAQLKVRAPRSWDAWEARLRAESGFGGWSVEPDELSCVDGGLVGGIRGMTFYRIAGTAKGVPLSVLGIVAPGVTAHMTVVPVYSALDLERPSFTMDTSTTISLGRNDPQPFLSATVAPRDLPDGSTTDHAGLQVTDCTTTGAGDVKITMRVDGAEPVVIAWCSGHLSEQPRTSVALDGAEHVVELFATGTTEGATVRISQFGWREQP